MQSFRGYPVEYKTFDAFVMMKAKPRSHPRAIFQHINDVGWSPPMVFLVNRN